MVTVILWRDGKLYKDGTPEEFAKALRLHAEYHEKNEAFKVSSGPEAHIAELFLRAAEVIEEMEKEYKELEESFWFKPEVSDDYSLGWSDGYSDGLNATKD